MACLLRLECFWSSVHNGLRQFGSSGVEQKGTGDPRDLRISITKKGKGPRCVPTCGPTWSESLGHRVFCWELLGDRLKRYHGWISMRGIPGGLLSLMERWTFDSAKDPRWSYGYSSRGPTLMMFCIARCSTGGTATTRLYVNAETMQLRSRTWFLGIVCQLLIWFGSIYPKKLYVWDVSVLEIYLWECDWSTVPHFLDPNSVQVVFATLHFTFQTTLILIPKYIAHTYISILGYCFSVQGTDHDLLQTIPNCSFLQQL